MGLFRSRKHSSAALGVDIGAAGVKIVELSSAGKGYKAKRIGFSALPKKAIAESKISDINVTSEAIQKAVSKSRTSQKNVVIAVPQTHVITRTINLPSELSDGDIEEQVMMESAQQIPHPIDEVYLDFMVSGPGRDESENQITITACRKEIVDDYVTAAELAGLSVVVVDIGLFAIERGYSFVAETLGEALDGRAIALIDFGDVTTRLDLFVDGRSVYGREQNFGGRILTENIRSRYGVDYREAEALKRTGELPQNYITDLLTPFKEQMAREAARSLELCLSAKKGRIVDAVLIIGGCSETPDVAPVIENYIGVPTLIGNPFAEGSIISAGDSIQKYGPLLVKAVGLAVRGIR